MQGTDQSHKTPIRYSGEEHVLSPLNKSPAPTRPASKLCSASPVPVRRFRAPVCLNFNAARLPSKKVGPHQGVAQRQGPRRYLNLKHAASHLPWKRQNINSRYTKKSQQQEISIREARAAIQKEPRRHPDKASKKARRFRRRVAAVKSASRSQQATTASTRSRAGHESRSELQRRNHRNAAPKEKSPRQLPDRFRSPAPPVLLLLSWRPKALAQPGFCLRPATDRQPSSRWPVFRPERRNPFFHPLRSSATSWAAAYSELDCGRTSLHAGQAE